MEKTKRKTAIEAIGDVPWGTHFCLFYQTKEDLIEILVPYFKTGLENNECCIWITSEPLSVEDAKRSLERVVKNLDGYIEKGQIEILDYSQWYTESGKFNADKVLQGWVEKENQAANGGFDGLRLTGNTSWLEKEDWKEFTAYEARIDRVIGQYRMLVLCAYSLDRCGASEAIDVVSNHELALIRQQGKWEAIQSAKRKWVEALREKEEFSRALFDYGPVESVVVDREGRVTMLNRAKNNSRHRLPNIGDVMYRDYAGKHERDMYGELMECIRSGRSKEFPELKYYQKFLSITISPFPEGAIIVSQDITERKKAEDELRKSIQRLNDTGEMAKVGAWELDLSTKEVVMTEEVCRLHGVELGYKPKLEEAMKFYAPESIPALEATLKKTIETGEPYDLESLFIPSGSKDKIWVRSLGRAVYSGGKIVKLAGTFQNIDKYKRAERELQEKSAALERFTYGISHDLKSPLVTVKTFLGYLEQDLLASDTGRIEKDMFYMRAAASKMGQSLDELLEVLRIGRIANPPVRVTFRELVEDALNVMAGPIAEREVKVQVNDAPITLYGDRPRLMEIWQNLVENAVKFMGDQASPRIEIGAERRGGDTVCFVRDNGIGIDPRHQAKVFGLFEKIGAKSEGAGLGLALVKRIVELYRGTIWLESKGLGQGACFLFTLPGAVENQEEGGES